MSEEAWIKADEAWTKALAEIKRREPMSAEERYETCGYRKTLSEKQGKEPEHTKPKWRAAKELVSEKQTVRTCIQNKTKGKLCVNNCTTCALYKQWGQNKNKRKKRNKKRKTLCEKTASNRWCWTSPKERYKYASSLNAHRWMS